MKLFWKWMYKNKYASATFIDIKNSFLPKNIRGPFIYRTKIKFKDKMLIGYMLDYIFKEDLLINLTKKEINWDIYSSKDEFKHLKKVINDQEVK